MSSTLPESQKDGGSVLLSAPMDDADALFALLCERRGWADDVLAAIESADHDELKDCDTMVSFLEEARLAGAKITIAPDFDMDGIASGVLGYAGLRELGFDVELHLPDYRRGHDLTPADIAEIHARWPQTSVLLTCDGGVNSREGVAAAHELGWTVLVTDHHQELEPGSTADITVNPCRLDETYALRGICGAHVLYQVLETYARRFQPFKVFAIRWLRLFAGLGTVSDVMPLLYENRQLVRDSLSIARLLWTPAPLDGGGVPQPMDIDVEASTMMRILRAEVHDPVFVSVFEGFACALKAFTVTGKIRDIDGIDEGFYGFYLAPAMNSPRRTEAPLLDCFGVFLARATEAKLAAAFTVIENNELRKELTARFMDELDASDQPLAPWVYLSQAPKGMLGLLAGKLAERHLAPVVVLREPSDPDEPVSGSGRAPAWFDIIETLDPHPGLTAIGHAQACGVHTDTPGDIKRLADVLATQAQALMRTGQSEPAGTSIDLVLGPDLDCDAPTANLAPLAELVRRISALRPFGHGFAQPRFGIVIEPRRCRLSRIGPEQQHLRLVTGDGLACLWWNAADAFYEPLRALIATQTAQQAAAVAAGLPAPALDTIRVDAHLQLNHWNGTTRLQAVVTQMPESEALLARA